MATFSVTNTNDIGAGSLRQAIREANALAGRDTINFDGVFADSIADTITLGSSLNIKDDLSIEGTGAEKLIVSGNNNSSVFEIKSGITLEIDGLTVANGRSLNAGEFGLIIGGGILNAGTLTVSDSIITDNTADSQGGGIYSSGTLTINNSTISNNASGQYGSGGGIYNSGTLTINNSTISNNASGGYGGGGGIYNTGTLTVNSSTISGNFGGYDRYSEGGGGILNSGVATVSNSTISNNSGRNVSGIYTYGTFILNNSTVSDNGGGEFASSISNDGTLTVNNTTISGSSDSGTGSGIRNSGTLTLNDSNITGNSGFAGSGIYNSGIATVNSSTISGNSVYGSGGGIYNSGTLTLSNSTISGNSAESGGAGIYNESTLFVNNSTIILNTSSSELESGAGIYNSNSGSANVKNSIIAGNTNTSTANPTNATFADDVRGNFVSNGYNLIGSFSSSTGFNASEQLNYSLQDVLDTTLKDNGGSVKTHALLIGSPAINGGNNSDIPTDTTDLDGDGDTTEQIPFDGRGSGFKRISGGQVDIGAFEAVINVINGTAADDILNGTPESDIIAGYEGKDTLTGGSGADAFIYTNIRQLGDTITDFQVGTDKFLLRQIFESLNLGNLNYASAISQGYLRFETQGTRTKALIDPDGNTGIGRAINLFTVSNVSATALNNANNFDFGLGITPPSTSIFTVTNTKDNGSGSLRKAIQDANAKAGKDIIKFDGVFADDIADTITLSGGSIVIRDDLSIDGTGAEKLAVSGNNTNLIFQINFGVTIDIVGLTITNGYSDLGGSIYNSGSLILANSIVRNNKSDYSGGGIYNTGSLTLTNSTISENKTGDLFDQYGGGIYNSDYGAVTLSNSTIKNNRAEYGGGIYSTNGSVTVSNSIFSGNEAEYLSFIGFSSGSGGGIYSTNSTLTVNNSTFSSNSANDQGGGIFSDRTLTVSNSKFDNNSANFQGSGIINHYGTLTVINSIFNNNSTNSGGGISNDGGTATVSYSTFNNNTVSAEGGGIDNGGTIAISNSTFSNNSSGTSGGGIYNGGTMTLTNSTINENSAKDVGGGIVSYYDTLIVNNSTISSNSAARGGGIFINATLTVNNSTITLNTAENEEAAGGIFNNESGTVTVKNSLIAGNNNSDVTGAFVSNGYNLIGSLSGSTGFNANEELNVPLEDVLDTTLQDNGGATKTHALVTGSRAINTGSNADIPTDTTDLDGDGNTTEPVPYDQRGSGFARISNGIVDIGAYEAVVNLIRS
ncbi:choice-of-anchor Q domain-containing protein [Nostoc sp. UHCC 0302]|uniref:choice-of-anchor Q domain-containing protein n=1 Tax=Nostoc sp. UHCC 0302 TaxID=3134896 RepID=UPI00311CB914